MSWGTITAEGKADELGAALNVAAQAYLDQRVNIGYPTTTEEHDQITAAVASASALAASGALGDYVRVMLGGHANPEHKPLAGWANDSISVSIWSSEPESVPATPASVESGPIPATATA